MLLLCALPSRGVMCHQVGLRWRLAIVSCVMGQATSPRQLVALRRYYSPKNAETPPVLMQYRKERKQKYNPLQVDSKKNSNKRCKFVNAVPSDGRAYHQFTNEVLIA